VFTNRRVLAWVDTGVPDGVQVDSNGNVYASCGDGVQVCFCFVGELFQSLKRQSTTQVFNPSGVLLGKIFLGTTSANHIFAGPGRMVILAETKIYLVNFAATPSLIELA
jgi:gluconolactonase